MEFVAILLLGFFGGPHHTACEVSDQGLNLSLLQWKRGVLITGLREALLAASVLWFGFLATRYVES